MIAGLDPSDLGVFVHLQWELHSSRAEPQPNAPRRAGLGETLKHGLNGGDDAFVGVEAHLAVLIAPTKPTGRPRLSSPRAALLRMPPLRRARNTCSSASLIVPLRPSSKRSLKRTG